jgi:hypothetical protein
LGSVQFTVLSLGQDLISRLTLVSIIRIGSDLDLSGVLYRLLLGIAHISMIEGDCPERGVNCQGTLVIALAS